MKITVEIPNFEIFTGEYTETDFIKELREKIADKLSKEISVDILKKIKDLKLEASKSIHKLEKKLENDIDEIVRSYQQEAQEALNILRK